MLTHEQRNNLMELLDYPYFSTINITESKGNMVDIHIHTELNADINQCLSLIQDVFSSIKMTDLKEIMFTEEDKIRKTFYSMYEEDCECSGIGLFIFFETEIDKIESDAI